MGQEGLRPSHSIIAGDWTNTVGSVFSPKTKLCGRLTLSAILAR